MEKVMMSVDVVHQLEGFCNEMADYYRQEGEDDLAKVYEETGNSIDAMTSSSGSVDYVLQPAGDA